MIASALTIAGTDPTGGAGIQADLKSFQEREVYGMSVVTSVVAQNTMGVKDVQHLPVDFIEKQLDAVFQDIMPDAVKTGMIATSEMMELIAGKLVNQQSPYVIDPVMVAKSGHELMEEKSKQTVRDKLIPLAAIATPNIPEAEILVEFPIKNLSDAKRAARLIVEELGAGAAIVKGGHLPGEAVDVLYDKQGYQLFQSPRLETKHTHGTGCTFSAVITSELAKGRTIPEAVAIGKEFITAAIHHTLGIGKGNGPTNHWGYRMNGLPGKKKGVDSNE
ncbi:bifunctional hydroxymethylpyrimidine kinase/phosphomethylpyrimidine kinase [Sediminibacillus dalangtanensis]|uniref:Hydroxymethylpyrimidine/phosphomethylpyrimidine kinase n=1 Tax=Sediminibacillus dalangtanensis TaxID=2729421 RepID=A0ABX7VR43_9BACI|nr:bifunctional hydroxymethylpyrimidine kinase/phosphomethylpyrimidine kinase [Sediminibacillus dalangtanensis]QTM98030.1 bifunctional hydroxymethylpyrimidine kinase/phosphomethylpyrimidine kinase [Sediminibacillus dalangtanensis]